MTVESAPARQYKVTLQPSHNASNRFAGVPSHSGIDIVRFSVFFFVSPNLENTLKLQSWMRKLSGRSRAGFAAHDEQFYSDGFTKLVKRLQRSDESEGSYVEK